MKIVSQQKKSAPFYAAWLEGLKRIPPGAHIASVPELALARAYAPRPHEPGKPWITYYHCSPLWENWWGTSTCMLIGHEGDLPMLLIVHGLEPPGLRDCKARIQSGKNLVFSDQQWHELLERAASVHRMSLVTAQARCSSGREDGYFRASVMINDHQLSRALFGDALELYADKHRDIAAQYLVSGLTHTDEMKYVPEESKDILYDPPIIHFDFSWLRREHVPAQGAIGRYVFFENIQNIGIRDVGRRGNTRVCSLSAGDANDEAKFVVVQ